MQTELYSEGMAVFTDVMDIEGLLSMPVFLEKLTDEQKERLYSDINLLWGMRVDAGSRVEGLNTSWKSYFDTSKREQDIDWDPIFGEKNRTNPAFILNGVEYCLGSMVQTFSGTNVQTYESSGTIDDDIIIQHMETEGYQVSPQATPSATWDPQYNCHTYAWYSRINPGNRWISAESTQPGVECYLADPHSTEVSTPSVGDIAVYMSESGAILHSGRVVSISPHVKIESKWGQGRRWIHRETAVPSDYKKNDGTTQIEYYHYNKTHNYTYTSISSTKHVKVCDVCFMTKTENHTLTYVSISSTKHRVSCTKCNYTRTESHSFPNNASSCSLCGGHGTTAIVYPTFVDKKMNAYSSASLQNSIVKKKERT